VAQLDQVDDAVARQPRPPPTAVAATASGEPSAAVSRVAGLLALASALLGPGGYLWGTNDVLGSLDTVKWAFAAGWGIPLALAAVLYLARAVPAQLAAGVFLGMGIVQSFDWLPSVLPGEAGFDGVVSFVWFGLASGLLTVVAGVIALARWRSAAHLAGS
jgi:hypothetical protein